MSSESRRLDILSAREITDLYGLPSFTDEERRLYFDLSPAEQTAVDAVHTRVAAVHMVLQLGYFKAKRQFFIYDPETVGDDIRHILNQHFPGMDIGLGDLSDFAATLTGSAATRRRTPLGDQRRCSSPASKMGALRFNRSTLGRCCGCPSGSERRSLVVTRPISAMGVCEGEGEGVACASAIP
jgi:hypothetical protein